MKQFEKIFALLTLIFAIGFNLWLYRLEPTAKIDPNDNPFQYALVDRTNQIWDFANKTCPKNLSFVICHLSFIVDHWVPNWAEGYNLPYYYSHIPQIAIVASWRLLSTILQFSNVTISLFQYYHLVIYLLLSFFPLPVFIALRVIGLPWLTAGFGGLIATHISTDGLYGLDPSSFLWRGYGLSSQLFAMFFLPLALAYAYKYLLLQKTASAKGATKFSQDASELRFQENFRRDRNGLLPAILFLAAATAGHLGLGIIAFMSIGVMAVSPLFQGLFSKPQELKRQFNSLTIQQFSKLFLLFGGVGLLLGYWILPTLLNGNYHNISVWDPIWKFNSYGAKEVLKNLFNGDLFDFGRFPTFTLLVFMGFFSALKGAGSLSHFETSGEAAPANAGDRTARKMRQATSAPNSYFPFAILFLFWLLMYFGRTTWGGLVDLIPGMKEFHLSRFIDGVHLAGFFLAPIGLQFVFQQFSNLAILHSNPIVKLLNGYIVKILLIIGLVFLIYPQTMRYSSFNDTLIVRGNENYTTVQADAENLIATLKALPPGRVFAGRGGGWGKDFKVAETTYFMHLSTYGIPTVLWLPETWSPNSDVEQYFSEDQPKDYDLFNIRYVATPVTLPTKDIQPFWKLIKEARTWKLYEVSSSAIEQFNNVTIPSVSYVTTGIRPAIVSVDKESFINVVHLWIQSDTPKEKLYPELTFAKNYPKTFGLPNFRMVDEINYKIPDGSLHNLLAEPPVYLPPGVESIEKFKGVKSEAYSKLKVISQESDSDMIFRAKVEVQSGCQECIVILKQSFHPSWTATIDGKRVTPFTVFPFFTAVPVSEGAHEVIFSYKPSFLKVSLLLVSMVTLVFLTWLSLRARLRIYFSPLNGKIASGKNQSRQ